MPAAVIAALTPARSVHEGIVAISDVVPRRFQLTHALQGESRVFAVFVAGLDHGHLTVGVFQAVWQQGKLVMGSRLCPGPVNQEWCQPGRRVFFNVTAARNGRTIALMKSPRPAWVEAGTAQAARRLIAMDIAARPDEIGPPIDVLELTRFGLARWIDRDPASTCEAIPSQRSSQ